MQKKFKWNIRKLATLSMLVALSVALIVLIRFPIIPIAPYLEYDPADIPILIGTFLYGPAVGLLLTVTTAAIQAMTVSATSGVYGFIMHVLATGSMVLVCGLIYVRRRDRKGALAGLLLGALAWTVIMIPANMIVTPFFLGSSVQEVVELLMPAIVPFNLIKSVSNGILAFITFEGVSRYLAARCR